MFRCTRQKKAVRLRSTTHNSIFFSSGLSVNLFAASSTTLHPCCVYRAFTEVCLYSSPAWFCPCRLLLLELLLIVSPLVVNHATYRLRTYLPASTRTSTRATPWQLLQLPVTLRHPPRLLRISRNRPMQTVFLRLKPPPTVWTTWTTRSSRIFRGKKECCCNIQHCPSLKEGQVYGLWY